MPYQNEHFQVEKYANGVAKVTISNPPLNMVTIEMLDEMYHTLWAIDRDDDVRVVVITGAGERAYCVGSDLKTFPDVWDDVVDKKLKRENEAFNLLEFISKPTIAAIEGYCYGGGCEMILACDLRIAAETAKLSLPEINVGVVPCSGAMFRLPKLIGLGKAYELMYLGEPVTAEYAERIGLINRVVPAGQAVESALKMAAKLAMKSDVAVRAIKKYAREMMEESTAANFQKNLEMSHLVFNSVECQEGVDAFFQKREPDFHKHKVKQ